MAKKKKTHNIRMSPKKNNKSKKVHFWDKELTTKQHVAIVLGFIALFVIGFFILVYCLGHDLLSNQGCDSPESTIKTYLTAMEKHIDRDIRKCFTVASVYGNQDYQLQTDASAAKAGSYVIDYDTLEIETHDYKNIIDVKNTMKIDDITDAKVINVYYESTDTTEGLICNQIHAYKFIVFQYNEKWYIYAAQNLNDATSSARIQSTGASIDIMSGMTDLTDSTAIGDLTVGNINIPKNWTENEIEADEFSSVKAYGSPDGKTTIMWAVLNDDIKEEDFTNQVKTKVNEKTGDPGSTSSITGTFCGYDCTIISTITDSSAGQFMAWIFKDNAKNPKTHYVEFQYTNDTTDYVNFVNTFRLSK